MKISVLVLLLLISLTASAGPIAVASWNLHWLTSSPNKNNIRKDADWRKLADYGRSIGADIVALQEVEDAAAARRVFGDDYDYYFSDRPRTAQRVGFAVGKTVEVLEASQYAPLGVAGSRYGLELLIRRNGRQMRFLNVHLKSGCHGELLPHRSRPCQVLERQIEALERYVDARAREPAPFVILGDFNRRLNLEAANRTAGLMQAVNDGEPNAYASLENLNGGARSRCWNGRYPDFIDHILADPRAKKLYVPHSFRELDYGDPANVRRQKTLSDHCPIKVLFK